MPLKNRSYQLFEGCNRFFNALRFVISSLIIAAHLTSFREGHNISRELVVLQATESIHPTEQHRPE
jgi:hypothetical protein